MFGLYASQYFSPNLLPTSTLGLTCLQCVLTLNCMSRGFRGIEEARQLRAADGFTRKDLIVTVASISLLGLLMIPLIAKIRPKSKTSVCADNLRALGSATALYSEDNATRLPFAYLHMDNRNIISWDRLVSPFIKLEAIQSVGAKRTGADSATGRLLRCPSDPLGPAEWAARYKLERRTYAMPRHDMQPANWPPGQQNATGIGLHWKFDPSGKSKPPAHTFDPDKLGEMVSLKTSMIPAPLDTILLTEQANSNNIVANSSGSVITRSADHTDAKVFSPDDLHRSRFNYLMIGGQVELLLPAQTVGKTGKAGEAIGGHKGMWTIKAGD